MEYIQKRLSKTSVKARKESYEGKAAIMNVSYSFEMHDLMTAEEASRYFSRDDKYRRQLVFVAGHYPIILQRVLYYDKNDQHYGLFEGLYDEAE